MAIVRMQKVGLCGILPEREALMKELQRRGVLHVTSEEETALSPVDVRDALTKAEKQAQLADNALKVLNEYSPAPGGLLSSLSGAAELSFAEWQSREAEREEAVLAAEDILAKQRGIDEATARAARAEVLMEGLAPWEGLDLPLNMTETASCRILIGALPGAWTEEAIREAIAAAYPEMEAYELDLLSGDSTQTPLVIACLKEDADAVEELLRKKGFARPVLSSAKRPAEALSEQRFERASAIAEAEELKAAIAAKEGSRRSLEFLYDDSRLAASRLTALGMAGEGASTFYLEGYVPAEKAAALKKDLEERFTVSVEMIEEPEGTADPVLLENNRFAAPTESVVESYGLPGAGEVDPTSVMAIFYYFLFGLMLSDAGYGLLMVIGCAILLKKFPKMSKGSKSLFTMFFWCGISTTVWGFLFGGFFGDAIDVIAHTFFGVPESVTILKPLWFAPLEDPMRLLIYSFLFGIIHLFVGLGLKGYQLLKQKEYMGFFSGVVCWYMFLIGLLLLLLPSDLFASIASSPVNLPAWAVTAGKVLAVAGVAGLVFFTAYDRKNWAIRIALGAYEVYGVTSWLSDVLSYSRLLALGLATGVIASVINSMGAMFGGGIGGAIAFIVIFLVGHALNMAINLLGAYVHTNRLQYVEFFGKFYDGGGTAYEPLAADNTKYYHMEDV